MPSPPFQVSMQVFIKSVINVFEFLQRFCVDGFFWQRIFLFCLSTVTTFQIEEYFFGFYGTDKTEKTLFKVVCDLLTILDLPINDLRGQCFDGASNISRVFNGLQAKLRATESKALFVHCQAHSLNLVTQDFRKNVIEVRDILQLTRELIT